MKHILIFISCFEKEYEKNGTSFMDVYIAIEQLCLTSSVICERIEANQMRRGIGKYASRGIFGENEADAWRGI